MPAGPAPLGFLYFTGIKALGYTVAAYQIKSGYGLKGRPKPSVPLVALTRTGIGVAAGIVYWSVWAFTGIGQHVPHGGVWYTGLLPVRVAEWTFLIWLFFDRSLQRSRLWKYVLLGIVWSYLLDVIGVAAAWVLPGGFWVC